MGNDKKYYKKIKKGMRKGSATTRSKAAGIMKLSTDPQSVMSRKRRHRIRERLNILQSMVPGTNKMDTVSMLEEAIQYVKFLKNQILLHQATMSYIYDPIIISPFSSFSSSISSSSSSSLLHSSVDIPIRMPSPQPISWPSYSFKRDDSCLMLQVYNHEYSS